MPERIRVAVVGAGHLGRHHARLYSAIPAAELVGVADIIPERARRVAEAYGARPTTDYRELIDQVDAASIAVPTEAHYAVARDFIERGRAVLIEKPLARSLDEADRLLDLAERNGVPVAVGHVERFNPALVAARRYLTTPLYLDADTPYAGRRYRVAGGISGSSPGTLLPSGKYLPVNWDWLTDLMFQYPGAPAFHNFKGFLDVKGEAVAAFRLGGPAAVPYIGSQLTFAFTLPTAYDFVSNPVTIDIEP